MRLLETVTVLTIKAVLPQIVQIIKTSKTAISVHTEIKAFLDNLFFKKFLTFAPKNAALRTS